MTATILAFPSHLCRRPATVIGARERVEFEAAAGLFTARPNTLKPMKAMIRLAMDGQCPTNRGRASAWLLEQCNI